MQIHKRRLAPALRLLIAACFIGGAAPALAGQITAELDRTEVELGGEALLNLTLAGEQDGEVALPDVQGLVMSQQGYSQSTVINNGQRVSEVAVTIVVRPQQIGQFTIPSIKATLDGEQVSTLPLTLKVVAAGGGSNNQAGAGGATKTAPKGAEDTGGVFIERECDKTNPFVGEQVACAIRIFHRGNLNGGQRPGVNSPDFRRFSVEGEKRYQRVVGGQRYAVIELRDIVVPTKSGKLTLPPFALEARVLTWSKRGNPLNKFFDRFGGGMFNFDMNFTEEKQVSIESDPTPFDVQPLPEAGKPTDFRGLVGTFQLNADVSPSKVAMGDTVTVTVTLSGRGVLDTVGEPGLDLKKLGRVYPDKPEYKENITPDDGIRSAKTFKFALVPDKVGEFPLGSVNMTAFDPQQGQYVSLQADLGQLLIEQGDAPENPLAVTGTQNATSEPHRHPVQQVAADLLNAHAANLIGRKQTITSYFLLFIISVGATPWFIALTILAFRQNRQRRQSSSASHRRATALKRLKTAFQQLGPLCNSAPQDAAVEAHKAFRSYIGDKANKHGGAFAAKELDSQLVALGAKDSVRAKTKTIVETLEQVEFGGRQIASQEAVALIADLQTIAEAMEST